MAKLTDDVRSKIVADYHTDKYSQRALAKKHNVSIGTINKLTKEIIPNNEHLVNAQVLIYSAMNVLPTEQMNAIMNTAKDEAYNMGLATNATQLNLIRMSQLLSENKKLEKINIGDGVQKFKEVGLGSADYKNIQEGIDKATVTLNINQRHANSQVQVNNQNIIEEKKWEVEIVRPHE